MPGREQRWHWAFTSCNGMDQDADTEKFGEPHLWGDLVARHAEAPLHVLVGGGDQLYNDALWTSPSLRTWLGGDGVHPGTVYNDDVRARLCSVCYSMRARTRLLTAMHNWRLSPCALLTDP